MESDNWFRRNAVVLTAIGTLALAVVGVLTLARGNDEQPRQRSDAMPSTLQREPPRAKVQAELSYHPILMPGPVQEALRRLKDIEYFQSLGLPDMPDDTALISYLVGDSTYLKLLETWVVHAEEGSVYAGTVSNNGNRTATGVTLEIPWVFYAEMTRRGSEPRRESVTRVIEIGSLRPAEDVSIRAWSLRGYDLRFPRFEDIILVHDNGRGQVTVGERNDQPVP